MKSWNELTRTQKMLLDPLVAVIVIPVSESSFVFSSGFFLVLMFMRR